MRFAPELLERHERLTQWCPEYAMREGTLGAWNETPWPASPPPRRRPTIELRAVRPMSPAERRDA
jgi:hypothetical protein